MASHLTTREVALIADLARLELSAAEIEILTPQLADILSYAAMVQQANTSELENLGTSEPRNLGTWRDDAIAPSIDRDAALAQSPDGVRESGLFRVPKVI